MEAASERDAVAMDAIRTKIERLGMDMNKLREAQAINKSGIDNNTRHAERLENEKQDKIKRRDEMIKTALLASQNIVDVISGVSAC